MTENKTPNQDHYFGGRKESFLTGALILTAATLVVRIIGGFQKLPLLWLIKEEGVGIYNYPFAFYSILLAFSSTGINIAVSKLVVEYVARNDRYGALRAFKIARWTMGILGAAAMLILAAMGRYLAVHVHHDPRAALSYWVLAPAAFLDTFQAAYRGFFQGLQNMRPNAISQVVEQLARVIVMLVAAYLLLPWGLDWAAGGATLGSSAGAFASFLFLLAVYRRALRVAHLEKAKPTHPVRPAKLLVKDIFRYALPISFAGIGFPIFLLADSLLVSQRLQAAGAAQGAATAAYGMLSNNAMSLINIPTILTSALFVTLVPAITESLVLGERQQALERARTALRVTSVFSLPAAAGMFLLAPGIASLLHMDPSTGPAVQVLSLGLTFLTLQQVTSGILQGTGHSIAPVFNMFLGAAIKSVLTYFWVFQYGVLGAAWATNAGFIIATTLNLIYLIKHLGPIFAVGGMLIRPGLATALMGAAVVFVNRFATTSLGSERIAVIVAVVFGGLTYAMAAILVGAVKPSDLAMVPWVGKKLSRILERRK